MTYIYHYSIYVCIDYDYMLYWVISYCSMSCVLPVYTLFCPNPWLFTDHFTVSIVLSCSWNHKICSLLISLGNTDLKFFYDFSWLNISFPFDAERYLMVWMYLWRISGLLSSFGNGDKAAISICVQVFV